MSPAFDIELSTYTDGTDGPYGSIPEGMTLELMGYTSYQAFNGDTSIKWETDGKVDPESIVKLIVSGLDWHTTIENSHLDAEGVYPIWDRYQYMHFDYTINNTSDNLGSIIEGFDVVFNIDSLDINGNGILPYDINRFKYVDNKAVPNDDINDINGEFIGVPDEGGVLIYDITNWDGLSELSNPIPYRYSGSGSITLNQSTGEYNKVLGAKGSSDPSERKYLIGLPLSRQGFPNLPTNFNLVAITNVLFAKGSSWTKTTTHSREVTLPEYNMSFDHQFEKKEVVFGYDTYFTIKNILNESNVPIFNPSIIYASHDKYELDFLRVKIAKDKKFSDDLREDFLTYFDTNQEEVIVKIPSTFTSDENYNYFDVDLKTVDKDFNIYFKDKLDVQEKLDIVFEVHGKPLQVGEMSNFANLEYIEKLHQTMT